MSRKRDPYANPPEWFEEPSGNDGLLSTILHEEVQTESPATMPTKGALEDPNMLPQGCQDSLSTRLTDR